MKEITVETTGPFMLTDWTSGHEIPRDEAVTVPHTNFITERLASKELRAVGGKVEGPAEPVLVGEKPAETVVPAKTDPLDHDGDGRKGGSKPRAKAKA